MNGNDTKKIVFVGLFIALDIIFTRFLSYDSPTLRISFAFVPIALCGAATGPFIGGLAAALADILGMALFPKGAFFPGFTLSAFLTGAVFGLFLYNKPKTLVRIGSAAFIVCMIINLGLDTLWVYMITGQGIWALLPQRIIKAVVMLPIQIVVLRAMLPYCGILWERKRE